MNKKSSVWSGITGLIASVLAFLGVVSCCGMPLIAGILATVGIGASQLNFFAEYKGWFIAFAIVSLIYGFYQAYFKGPKSCCASSKADAKGKKRSVLPKIFLWVGTIVTLLALFMQTPENTNAGTSGCCPFQASTSCASGCSTGNSACCSSFASQKDAEGSCTSQPEMTQEDCCGN